METPVEALAIGDVTLRFSLGLEFLTLHAANLILYPVKTSENILFSDVFRRFRKRSVV